MHKRVYEERITLLRKKMEESGLDAFILKDTADLIYFTNFSGGSLLLVTNEDSILYVPNVNYEEAKRKVSGYTLELLQWENSLMKVSEALKELKLLHVAFKGLRAEDYLKLSEKLSELKLEPRSDIIWSLRKVKDENEVALIRKASEITTQALDEALNFLKPGMKEFELAAKIEQGIRLQGADGLAFEIIVASGERTVFPHGGCTEKRIRRGDLLMIDVGAKYRSYCTDITRTFVLGKPSEKHIKIFRSVKLAQEWAFSILRSGIEAWKADRKAREILEKEELKKYFVHSLGHGVGLEIHEPPTLRPGNSEVLNEGNVVTVEPGVYIPRFGGFRIEDTVVIRKSHAEKLTIYPTEITINL